MRILDLAIKMIRAFGLREGRDVPIVYTGLRPGERLLETLVAEGEELVPTLNSKIFSVKHGDDVPVLAQVTRWMLSLDEALRSENSERLRERLFELVQVHELLRSISALLTKRYDALYNYSGNGERSGSRGSYTPIASPLFEASHNGRIEDARHTNSGSLSL